MRLGAIKTPDPLTPRYKTLRRLYMSRPKGIYLILIWFFISVTRQMNPLLQMVKNHNLNNEALPPWVSLALLGLFIFLIVIMVGLFKLEKISRWVAIIFFGICTIIILINMALLDTKINFKVIILASIIYIVPNILSIWYLLSKGFNNKSEDFKKEKEKYKFMPSSNKVF